MKRRLFLPALLLASVVAVQAQTTVSGTVTDKKGNPIPGAKVEIPGTEESVLTNLDGTFTLTSTATVPTVNVYYVGMQPKSQSVVPDMVVRLAKTTWWNKQPDRWQFFAAVQGAFPESGMKNPAFGLSVGVVKNYGVYAKALFSSAQKTEYEWDDFGALKPWTTGERKNSMNAYVVGGIVRLGCALHLNLGLGYMDSEVAWEVSDGSYAKYNDDSYSGLCFDAGLLLRAGDHLLLGGGLLLGNGSARAPYLNIGYCF